MVITELSDKALKVLECQYEIYVTDCLLQGKKPISMKRYFDQEINGGDQ